MQAVSVAVLGFFGLLIPSLLTIGTVHGRRLKHLREEIETYKSLPDDFTAERQLTRYLINESVWQYAQSRRRLYSRTSYFAFAVTSSAVMSTGLALIQFGDDPSRILEPKDDPNLRAAGVFLLAAGAVFYFLALYMPISGAQTRIKGLGKPLPRIRQLIALEAQVSVVTDLSDVEIVEPSGRDLRSRLFLTRKWAGLEERARAAIGDGRTEARDPVDTKTDRKDS